MFLRKIYVLKVIKLDCNIIKIHYKEYDTKLNKAEVSINGNRITDSFIYEPKSLSNELFNREFRFKRDTINIKQSVNL